MDYKTKNLAEYLAIKQRILSLEKEREQYFTEYEAHLRRVGHQEEEIRIISANRREEYDDLINKLKEEISLRNRVKDSLVSIAQSVDNINKKSITLSSIVSGVYGTLMGVDKSIRRTNLELGFTGGRAQLVRDSFYETAGFAARIGASYDDMSSVMTVFANETGRARALSADAMKNVLAMAKGTALGVEGAAQMVSHYHLIGVDAQRASEHTLGILEASERMGVSAGKVLNEINKNFSRLRTFTFVQGVKGFAQMATYAEKMRMDMSQALDSAEAARRLENVIEMAAQLQVMGGEFAKTDPFELLFLARNDPAEYAKRINEMTKSVITFRKMADGTYEQFLSPADRDRLTRAADVLGLQSDELINQARRQAEIQKIRSQMYGMGLSPEEKEAVEGIAKFDSEMGKFVVHIGNTKKTIENLNRSQIRTFAQQAMSLEDRAKAAQTFDEAFKATVEEMKTALLPILNGINAVLEVVRPIAIWFNELLTGLGEDTKKFLAAVGILGVALKGFMMAGGSMLLKMLALKKSAKLSWGQTLGRTMGGIGTTMTPTPIPGAGAGAEIIGRDGAPINAPARKMWRNAERAHAEKMLNIEKERSKLGRARPTRGAGRGMGMLRGGAGIGAAALGIGAGIGIAALGISELAKAMKELDSTQIWALPVTVASLSLSFFALAPAIKAVGLAGTAGSFGLLAIGAAAMGIGAGIGIAAYGISHLATAMGELDSTQIWALPLTIGALAASFWILAPAIKAVGLAGTIGVVGLLAIGAAAMGIGAGVAIAAYGVGYLSKNLVNLIESSKDAGPAMLNLGIGVATLTGALMGAQFGIIGMVSLNRLLGSIAKKADDLSKVGFAMKEINTLMSGSEEDFNRIKGLIDSINKIEIKEKTVFSELKELFSKPLTVEFKDKEVALVNNITLDIDGHKIIERIGARKMVQITESARLSGIFN